MHTQAPALQVMLELAAMTLLVLIVGRLAWLAHRRGVARVRAAQDRDTARILEGIRVAKVGGVVTLPDGTQVIDLPRARPATSPWED
jgi:hypothetical protein